LSPCRPGGACYPDRTRQCNSPARIGLSLAKDLWVARPLRRNAQHPGFERGRVADVAFVDLARHEGSFRAPGNSCRHPSSSRMWTGPRASGRRAPRCSGCRHRWSARAESPRDRTSWKRHPGTSARIRRRSAGITENCTADMRAPSRLQGVTQPLEFGAKADFAASAAGALRARRKGAWPNFIATSFQRAS
jgi:hypothetical protein